jgi:hypothetical protein
MCDLGSGEVIVTFGHEGAAQEVALRSLNFLSERYGSSRKQSLNQALEQEWPSAWESHTGEVRSPDAGTAPALPFRGELWGVEIGSELSFVDELRSLYLELVLQDPTAIKEAAKNPDLRLTVSPNWRLHPAAGVAEAVTEPFKLSSSHSSYLKVIGLDKAGYADAQGITVAVLDNGFDNNFWVNSPSPVPVSSGKDLISGDTSTSGHGTLVAALVAESAPGATVVPLRMAGQESTEWDALHALGQAVQLGAHVITFSYSQILAGDKQCLACGLVRTAARSEVFARMVGWASDHGTRAVLAAAGNDGMGSIARPAAYNGAIAIAALETNGTRLWKDSNWDAGNRLKVLALPGEDVAFSTASTAAYSGTSFATAYAAALYAVQMGRKGTTDASSITGILTSGSHKVSNASIPLLS